MKQSTQSSGTTSMAYWIKKRNQEAINVDESKQSRIKHDIFDTSAKGLCSDSQVQLQNTKNTIKNLNSFGDGVYTTRPGTSCDEDHRPITHSNNKPVLASKEPNLQAYTGDHFEKIWNLANPKHGSSSLKRSNGMFRSSLNKVETTRICTTADSVVGLGGRHSRISQTTHSLLITKQKTESNHTYFNSRKGIDFSSNKFNTVTPLFSGDKIRSLQRFMDSEPQQEGISKLANVGKNVENASDFEDHKNSKGKKIARDSELSSETEQSTLRTQSLDKETILSHAKQVNEPGGRWLKSLRLMNSTSSCSITTNSSEDYMEKPRNDHGKEVAMVIDEATTLKTHRLLLDMDSAKKDIDALLSKSWIKRWSPNPKKKVDEEPPRGSKLEDMKKKQFPSIAAMALMAKTMNCSESYDVCNRGAVTVWTTKDL